MNDRVPSRPWWRRRWVWLGAGLVGLVVVVMALPGSPAVRLLRQDLTWRSMDQRGVWRVGMDPSFPPFEVLDATGQPAGYDVDLARAIAATWGMEAEIVSIGYDSLIDALLAGKVDSVVSALPYDPRLTKDIAYSEPYFEAGLRLAVPAGSSIASTDDLAGARVAVEWGSTGDMIGRQLQRSGIDFILLTFPTPDEALATLLDGAADALLVDNVTLRQAQGRGAAVVAVGPVLDSISYGIAAPLHADQLQRALNNALDQLREQGVMAELEKIWFGPLPADINRGESTQVIKE